MGMKTWKIGAKAAGTHVGGRIIVANRFGEIDGSGRELGHAVVAGLNRAARKRRTVSMKQPEAGEVAEHLAGIVLMAGLPLLLLMRQATTVESAGSAARLMVEISGEALAHELRFAGVYGLAISARECDDAGRLDMMGPICDTISRVLPQPLSYADEADRAMRVEIREVEFPEPSAELAGDGLAEMGLNYKCSEVDGSEIGKDSGSAYFPLSLFAPGTAEPRVVMEMWVDGLQLIVDLEAKLAGYGALRDMVYAVEEAVDRHRFSSWGMRPA